MRELHKPRPVKPYERDFLDGVTEVCSVCKEDQVAGLDWHSVPEPFPCRTIIALDKKKAAERAILWEFGGYEASFDKLTRAMAAEIVRLRRRLGIR